MNLKILEIIKQFNLEDSLLLILIEKSFNFYYHNKNLSLSDIETDEKKKVFSIFYRFFKSFNINKIIGDEVIANTLKDIFKNKPNSLNIFSSKINLLFHIQKSKNNFSNIKSCFNIVNYKTNYDSTHLYKLRKIKNFQLKLNIVISNNSSNRVLNPEIYLIIQMDDFNKYTILIDMKVFQVLRKNLALNIKKIFENESISIISNNNIIKEKLIV